MKRPLMHSCPVAPMSVRRSAQYDAILLRTDPADLSGVGASGGDWKADPARRGRHRPASAITAPGRQRRVPQHDPLAAPFCRTIQLRRFISVAHDLSSGRSRLSELLIPLLAHAHRSRDPPRLHDELGEFVVIDQIESNQYRSMTVVMVGGEEGAVA